MPMYFNKKQNTLTNRLHLLSQDIASAYAYTMLYCVVPVSVILRIVRIKSYILVVLRSQMQ